MDNIKSKLRVRSEQAIEKNKIWFNILVKDVLDEIKSIPYAILKGEPLSVMAFGDTGYRNSHDLDILIDKKNRGFLKEVLLRNHFLECAKTQDGSLRPLTRRERIMLANSHQDAPYLCRYPENHAYDLLLDINYQITWGEYAGEAIPVDEWLMDAQEMSIYDVTVKTLSPAKAFVQLCLHHYKEMNAIYVFKLKNPFDVKMFQDIACFLSSLTQSEIDQVIKLTRSYHLQVYMYYILYYTYQIFKEENLKILSREFKTSDGVRRLNMYGLADYELKEWKIDFESRLMSEDIYQAIEQDLSAEDKEKVAQSVSIL